VVEADERSAIDWSVADHRVRDSSNVRIADQTQHRLDQHTCGRGDVAEALATVTAVGQASFRLPDRQSRIYDGRWEAFP